MAEQKSANTSLGEKQAASPKTSLSGSADSASAKVAMGRPASAKVGIGAPASAKVGLSGVGQTPSPAVTLAERPEDVSTLVSRIVKGGGSATVRLKGRTLQSALASLGDQLDSISAVVTLRGNTPAK